MYGFEEALKEAPGGTHIMLSALDNGENHLVVMGY